MEKIFFFHGGPGFNGNPERCLLKNIYNEAGFDFVCWDEPSTLRPGDYLFIEENAFDNYLKSAEKFLCANYNGSPITLVVFCFTTHILNYLLKKHIDKIKLVVIITPDYCLSASDQNIFSFVEKDYREHGDSRADTMLDIIKNYREPTDENTMNGWNLAAVNPRLFNYYWRSSQQMEAFTKFYNGRYSIDPLSFFSVRKSWYKVDMPQSSIQSLLLYGRYDRIVSVEKELKNIVKYFGNLKIVEMAESGHYPHIEEPGEVVRVLKEQLSAMEA